MTDERHYPYKFWEPPLKELFRELVWVDLKKIYFNNGKKKSQIELIKIIEKEKPDYLLMFESMYYDLDLLELLQRFREKSNKTKTILFSGDNDITFDYTRYFCLFFDYMLLGLKDYIDIYLKDGLKNVSYIGPASYKGVLSNKKKYDVSFAGADKADRKEILEYLYRNGVNISIFGYPHWEKYPELKKVYKGFLSSEEYLKTISQSKINLCFSKNMLGGTHLTGRFLENSICKAFSLIEYTPELIKLFKENKEIVTFKTKEEALEKIKYYLKNEKEREKIANAAYNAVNERCDLKKEIMEVIKKINKIGSHNLPPINYSIINLNESMMNLSKKDIFDIIKGKEYISFSKNIIIKSKFKDYLQVYSLIKDKKDISCCDYFIYSKHLGDLARFRFIPFGKALNKNYSDLLNINQIVVTRKFFENNFEKIKHSYKEEKINWVNKENTTFVSIPLVKIKSFRKHFFKNKEFLNELGLFTFSFHREIYARRKDPIKLLIYLIFLIKEILSGKRFILNQAKKKLFNKEIKNFNI